MTADAVETTEHSSRWRSWLKRGLALAAVGIAGWLLYETLHRYSLDELKGAVTAVPVARLGLAGLCAAGSYLCLTLFDRMALAYVGRAREIGYPRTALASFVSLSLGHSIGFAGISSGAIRYRYYSRWGLSTAEVAKVVLFSGLTVALGLLVLAGLALSFDPGLAEELGSIARGPARALGMLCLALAGAYWAATALRRRPFRIRGHDFALPSSRLALSQLVIGTLDFALVAGCLHQTLKAVADVDYPSVVGMYVTANVATLITHVPGGLGVIEGVVTHLVPEGQAIGSVLVFRAVYFLIPLMIGLVVFGVTELWLARRKAAARD